MLKIIAVMIIAGVVALIAGASLIDAAVTSITSPLGWAGFIIAIIWVLFKPPGL